MIPATLVLTEGVLEPAIPLSSAEYRALNATGIVTAVPTLESGCFDLLPGRKVGAISLGTRQVIVKPKIADLNRLLFLLGYAQNPSVWREDTIAVEASDELFPAIAESFARLATRAVEQGLLQGYKTVAEDLPVLRGRIRAGDQMGRLYGLPVPIAVEYDDFTSDIPENQLLAMATLRVLGVPRISDSARRTLLRLRRTLADVSVPTRGTTLPIWRPSRLNVRYEPALRMAEIILAAMSFDHKAGELSVTGYMFDMWRIFEDFVTTALAESLSKKGWTCKAQASLHLDVDRRVQMKPDLLCRRNESLSAVIDAKYKAERPEGFPNADLYQMMAYCAVLGLPEGHLVYAKGNEPTTSHTVQGSGTEIHCHALDLTLSPTKLLSQVDELAYQITRRQALA